jgi:hypothetical protein
MTTPRSPIRQAAADLETLKRYRERLLNKLTEVDADIRAVARHLTDLVGEPLTGGATREGGTLLRIPVVPETRQTASEIVVPSNEGA